MSIDGKPLTKTGLSFSQLTATTVVGIDNEDHAVLVSEQRIRPKIAIVEIHGE